MSRDYEEFLASLNESGARYLIVGAHAVAYHALPRSTKDLDVYIEPAPENAERVLIAIRRFFGGNDLGFTVADLTNPETIVQTPVEDRERLLAERCDRRFLADDVSNFGTLPANQSWVRSSESREPAAPQPDKVNVQAEAEWRCLPGR